MMIKKVHQCAIASSNSFHIQAVCFVITSTNIFQSTDQIV